MSERDDLERFTRAPVDPIELARRDLKKALPKRFYAEVAVAATDGGFGLRLDGKPVRTPAKAPLVVPSEHLADMLAAEWRAQGEWIEPHTMPMTRLVNSALDGVDRARTETAAEIAKFAESDLVYYRAGEPDSLVAAQSQAWDPVLAFARETLGARFICTQGIVYVTQPAPALAAVRAAVNTIAETSALKLAALSVMTSLTGSVLIALAVAYGAMSPDAAWAAAHVDEDFQMRLWGEDAEAMARRETRWHDMRAAAEVFATS